MLYGRHSVLKRGCSIWDRERMPQEEYEGRLRAVQRLMEERGLDALVVYGDTWAYADLCYVTGYFPKVRGGVGIIPRSGPVSLLLHIGSRDVPFARSLTWVEDVRASSQVGRDAAGALTDLGLSRGKIGIADSGKGFPLSEAEGLKGGLPDARWEDSSSRFQDLRLQKSPRELALMTQAGRILKTIGEEARTIISAGKKEYEIAAEVDRLARLQGVEDLRLMLGDRRPQPPGDKLIEAGQSHLTVYLAVQYERYWAEIGRTYSLTGSPEVEALKKTAENALRKMSDALRPSVSTADICALARQEMGESCATAMTYGLGNGIGMGQWEPPFVYDEELQRGGPQGGSPLREDMALALRVAVEAQGKFALVGDSYQITSQGPRPLTV